MSIPAPSPDSTAAGALPGPASGGTRAAGAARPASPPAASRRRKSMSELTADARSRALHRTLGAFDRTLLGIGLTIDLVWGRRRAAAVRARGAGSEAP